MKQWRWIILGLVCGSYKAGNYGDPINVQALYKQANHYFSLANPTDATDSLALHNFELIIDKLEKQDAHSDTLLFFSYLRKGVLLDVKENLPEARTAYQKAYTLVTHNPQWNQGLLYQVSLYTGALYFRLNNFDSASYYLLKAEALSQQHPEVKEKERLYNSLGVLHHENGNYLQSKNYFSHALELTAAIKGIDPFIAIDIQNNIAADCYKLGLYQQALSIYQKIQTSGLNTSLIWYNMGNAYQAMGAYQQALAWYQKVNPKEIPNVYNEQAHTCLFMGQRTAADNYLKKLEAPSDKNKLSLNNVIIATNYLYRADWLIAQQQYEAALPLLQKSIIISSGHFNNTDLNSNPTSFVGTFTSYRLFDALYKKALTLEKVYKQQHKESLLQAALQAYNSAIALLRYIEKCYSTDDAKLFLKSNNQDAYQHAFSVCMQLHALHPNEDYLEQAFITGERNKASVMYAGFTERSYKKIPGIDPALLQQERNIKYNLARLSIKGDQTQDSATLESIAKEKARLEISLSQLQNSIEQNSAYYQQKYAESYPDIATIRQHISKQQAVISFYTTTNQLHVFAITQSQFSHITIDSFAAIKQNINHWLTALTTTGNGKKFNAQQCASALYKQLVQPVQELAGNKKEWVIIPDGLLYYLPFESLPADKEGATTLLETTAISYQFSSRFIVAAAPQNTTSSYTVLAMAPFAQQERPFPHHEYSHMNRLAASGKEITGLPGKTLFDSQATKQQFLRYLTQYPVVHLATHAIADTGSNGASFIAFYPRTQTPGDDALYLEELYSLNMDTTQLVIISACETGNGQLVNSEGVLSITRGFAYAGCKSVVSSLWKADDEATAVILKQFHHYLQKGYNKSVALQQAKLDYIHSNSLHTTPDYWANLIVMGNTAPIVNRSTRYTWLLAAGALITISLITGVAIRKKRKKSTWLS